MKVKFVKNYLTYKVDNEVELDETEANELITAGKAVAVKVEAGDVAAKAAEELLSVVDEKIANVEKKIAKAFSDRKGSIHVGANRADEDPTKGFKSLGHFALSVKNGEFEQKGAAVVSKATGASVGTDADGGFAVPDVWANEIYTSIVNGADLFSRCRNFPMSGPGSTLKIPADNITTLGTNGFTAQQKTRGTDGASITPTKPRMREISIDVNREVILAPVTDDLLSDAIALGAYLDYLATLEMAYRLNNNILRGGTLATGILGHGSVVTQLRKTANRVQFDDIRKMWGRRYGKAGSFVWIANQEVEPELFNIEDSDGHNLYFYPGQLGNNPTGMIFGAPVLVSEHSSSLGSEGDLVLASMENYLTVTKGGMDKQVSPHLYFDTAEQAFRWTFRVGGRPARDAAVTPASGQGTLTLSPFVVLDDATS